MINLTHLILFILAIVQSPVVAVATLFIGFYIALLFGTAMLGVIQEERR